jgi:hypothetical protein
MPAQSEPSRRMLKVSRVPSSSTHEACAMMIITSEHTSAWSSSPSPTSSISASNDIGIPIEVRIVRRLSFETVVGTRTDIPMDRRDVLAGAAVLPNIASASYSSTSGKSSVSSADSEEAASPAEVHQPIEKHSKHKDHQHTYARNSRCTLKHSKHRRYGCHGDFQ